MDETIETYNKAAESYAKKFNAIPPRVEDVQLAIQSWGGAAAPHVVEWGCGNGRDAQIICNVADTYVGIDASSEMIRLAQQAMPHTQFVVADIATFTIPAGTDIVFAFASLLHFNKETITSVLRRAHPRLAEGGIIFISLKRDAYQERSVTDAYGPRTFYFYEREDIEAAAGEYYRTVHYAEQMMNDVPWFTIVLKKSNT